MEYIADQLYDIPKNYHYIFDLVHFILCIQGEKLDLDGDEFSRKNPFSCWLSSMMVCFAGGLFVNPLCGEPIFDADPLKILLATVLWYLIFYVDPVYKFSKSFPAKIPLYLLKGLYYPKKIWAGIKHAKKPLRGNVIGMIVAGVLKGNGSGFMKPFARLIRGSSSTSGCSEFMSPSVTTKYCFVAAIILMLGGDFSYILITGLLVAMKMGPLFGLNPDLPFQIAGEKVSPFLFGVVDKKDSDKKDSDKKSE